MTAGDPGKVAWTDPTTKAVVMIDPDVEWVRCAASFWYYLTFVMIEDAHEGVVRYERWDYMRLIAEDWQAGHNCVEGKARQLGYSWLGACFINWKMQFHDNAHILCFSIGIREAKTLIGKISFVHNHLPKWLQLPWKRAGQEAVELAGTDSWAMAFPSTETAGSGEQGTLVFSDELAKHPYARANFSSYRPAIAQGGQHIIVSTGWGITGMFRDYFEGAAVYEDQPRVDGPVTTEQPAKVLVEGVAGKNGYRAHFRGFFSRPDRTEQFYEQERQAYLTDDERGPTQFKRENPVSIEEMFGSTAKLVYDNYSTARHIRLDPFMWEDADLRVIGVDPGQGDNAAMIPIGVKAGHKHQFDEWVHPGTTTSEMMIAYAQAWQTRGLLHAMPTDHNEGTLIATFQARGLPAVAANKERGAGFGVVEAALEAGTFTHAPHCLVTQREFQSYRYTEKTIPGESQELTTSTPTPGHGDTMDGGRYAMVWISQYGAEAVKVRQPPDFRHALTKSQEIAQRAALRGGIEVTSEKFDLEAGDPFFERRELKPGSGPDYRPSARAGRAGKHPAYTASKPGARPSVSLRRF